MPVSLTNINVGAAPDDGTGDRARTAFGKINTNNAKLEAIVLTQSEIDASVVAQSTATRYAGQNLQTGIEYTLALSDVGKIVEMNNAGANVLNINNSIGFPINTRIDLIQGGAGQTRVRPSISSTAVLRGGNRTRGQYQMMGLTKVNATEWFLVGGIQQPSTLLDGLISWWDMDEISGDRIDSHGGFTLASNGVGSALGKVVAKAANFVASEGDFLSRAATPYAGTTGTLAFWAKNSSSISNQTLFTFNGLSELEFKSSGSGGALFVVNADSLPASKGSLTMTSWNLFLLEHTPTLGRIYVNNVVGSDSSGSYTAITGSGDLVIGERATSGENWNGQIGPFSIWNRILTSDERAELYNSGNGLGYDDIL
jgi:hypothetical protein